MKSEDENVKRIHSNNFVLDAHSDIPLEDIYPRRAKGEKEIMKRIHLPRFEAGGVHGAVMTVHCDCFRWATHYEGACLQTLEIIDSVYSEQEETKEQLVVAKNGSEMEEAHNQGKFSMLMSLEGGKALEGSLHTLRTFYRLGVRAVGLTHNVRNQLADGAAGRENYGLTEFGKSVVEEVDKLHMVLDLAHLSERGFYDAIEIVKSPPIVSHSACNDLYRFWSGKVPWRNVTDRQIEALADKGGVIGIACLKSFLNGPLAVVDDAIAHIERVIKLVGIDHVGIGADFIDYSLPINQAWLGENEILSDDEVIVKDLENITKIPNITGGLLRRGYSETEIGKILGGNFLRLLKNVLG